MKKEMMIFSLAILVLLCLTAVRARGAEDIGRHRACSQCGMDRKSFGYSRMLIVYRNGSSTGLCSIHCAVRDMDRKGRDQVERMLVADRNSRTLVDPVAAVWVMGGDRKGVMTFNPKWAFAERRDAEEFVKRHGGRIVSFETILETARKEAQE